MIKLLDLVDAVFVINLPERVDRRSRMDKVLASIGLSFDQENVFLFPAVCASNSAFSDNAIFYRSPRIWRDSPICSSSNQYLKRAL
ncbi:MAG: hypothetical protein ACPGMR_14610 [Pontibacterium sp.]